MEHLNHFVQTITNVESFEFRSGVTPLSHPAIPLATVLIYMITIFSLQRVFKNRPYNASWLKSFTNFHNLFLCLLSVFMVAFTCVFYVMYGVQDGSWLSLICDAVDTGKGHTAKGPLNWITYIFYLSKFYELIDTLLIVVRDKPLIFLHWYHHVVTLLIVYVGLVDQMSLQWVPVITNAGVHIIMYYYYYLTANKQSPWWKKYITQLQIVQFVFDLILPQIWIYNVYVQGQKCRGSLPVFLFGEAIIFSFLLLFIKFFFTRYTPKEGNSKQQPVAAKKQD